MFKGASSPFKNINNSLGCYGYWH